MTAKEMLKVIDKIHDYPCPYGIGGTAWIEIRNCIEKQIPKKPIFVDTRFKHLGKHVSDGTVLRKCYKCPNCSSHIFHEFDSEECCVHCGQALDWSDDE